MGESNVLRDFIDEMVNVKSAVALAFGEVRTLHASGQEICLEKIPTKRNRETNEAF